MLVYQRLVANVRVGFSALDDHTQDEIKDFIKSQQHENGAFTDRGEQADLYYSLFGLWLIMATEQREQRSKLKAFVLSQNKMESTSLMDELALTLLEIELDPNYKIRSAFSMVRKIICKGRGIDFSYQFFLMALVIDAGGGDKRLFHFFARIWLLCYKPKENISCSLSSALLYARKTFNLNTRKLQEVLSSFMVSSGGFRAFKTIETADNLSTGVALFVLSEVEYDLRMVLPEDLDFIQKNYSEGAFLSGDGDKTKDLEYTFYGLLALGSLLNKREV